MTDALRFENVRVTTIRSTYWIGLLGLLLCGLVALGFGLDSPETGLSAAESTFLLTAVGKACRSRSWAEQCYSSASWQPATNTGTARSSLP